MRINEDYKMNQEYPIEVPTIDIVISKITDPEYIKDVILKYLLEAALLTFAYMFVVQRKISNRRTTPSIDTVTTVFVSTIILFSTMDLMCPQSIPMVRAGVGLCIGTHMAGGIAMEKL